MVKHANSSDGHSAMHQAVADEAERLAKMVLDEVSKEDFPACDGCAMARVAELMLFYAGLSIGNITASDMQRVAFNVAGGAWARIQAHREAQPH